MVSLVGKKIVDLMAFITRLSHDIRRSVLIINQDIPLFFTRSRSN